MVETILRDLRGIVGNLYLCNTLVGENIAMMLQAANIRRYTRNQLRSFLPGLDVGDSTCQPWDAREPKSGRRSRISHNHRILVVQSISIARIFATLLFIGLAFQNTRPLVLISVYAFAAVTDLIDGYASRRLNVVSDLGKVVDLVADKSLTAVSLLYAAASGVNVFPIAVIATRDIVMIGMRLVVLDGAQLLPTNRLFGGMMATLLWGNTLLLVVAKANPQLFFWVNGTYWVCALVFGVNLVARLKTSAWRIKKASMESSQSKQDGNCPTCKRRLDGQTIPVLRKEWFKNS